MATKAKQVDFLLNGYRDPTTDVILSGGKVTTKLAGTSTLSALWTDRDKGANATNPIILGSDGTAEVFGDGIYDFVITDSADNPVDTLAGLDYRSDGENLDDMLALINISAPSNNDVANISGFFFTAPESNPTGGGSFVWQASLDKNLANGGTIVDPDNVGGFDGTVSTRDAFLSVQGGGVGVGCWVRFPSSNTLPEWFGAVGSGTDDDTAALNAALNTIDSSGLDTTNSVQLDINKRYLVDSADLLIPRLGVLFCAREHVSTSAKDYTVIGGAIVLNPLRTIMMDVGSQIKGTLVVRKGILASVTDGEASFSGTAITFDEGDCYVGRNSVIGFEFGMFNDGSKARPRIFIEQNAIDCINGISIGNASDPCRVYNNHLFPFTSPVVGDNHLRSGTGIRYHTRHDHTQSMHNVVYGYEIGFHFENTQNMVSINDFYDTVRTDLLTGPKTSVGMQISGTPAIEFTHIQLTLICPQISAAERGLLQFVPDGQFTIMNGPAIFANDVVAVKVQGGDLAIDGGFLTSTVTGSKGIILDDAASRIRYNGVRFVNYDTRALEIEVLAGVITADLTEDIFSQKTGVDISTFHRAETGGVSKVVLDNVDNTGDSFLQYTGSRTLSASVNSVEGWRISATGMGIGTVLPRTKLHGVGTSVIGCTTELGDTLLDDNADAQVNFYLDEGTNTLKFKVIYSGIAGDTGRTIKTGSVALT